MAYDTSYVKVENGVIIVSAVVLNSLASELRLNGILYKVFRLNCDVL